MSGRLPKFFCSSTGTEEILGTSRVKRITNVPFYHPDVGRNSKAVRTSERIAQTSMQASPRAGSARPTARPVQRPGSARPRGAENRQLVERFAVSPRMRPDELPNFGLNFHPKYPERRPQTNNSPRSPRSSPRNAPPKPAPLTTARIQEPHGFEPAGYKQPWGGLPDAKFPPWMRYGAQCTMKQRPTSAHAMNKEPAEFHKAVMQEFVDAVHADGEIDDANLLPNPNPNPIPNPNPNPNHT